MLTAHASTNRWVAHCTCRQGWLTCSATSSEYHVQCGVLGRQATRITKKTSLVLCLDREERVRPLACYCIYYMSRARENWSSSVCNCVYHTATTVQCFEMQAKSHVSQRRHSHHCHAACARPETQRSRRRIHRNISLQVAGALAEAHPLVVLGRVRENVLNAALKVCACSKGCVKCRGVVEPSLCGAVGVNVPDAVFLCVCV